MIQLTSQREQDRPFNLLVWGHWFAFGNLFIALFLSSFYVTASPLPNTFVGQLYLLTTWLGHFAFLSLAGFILTIFPFITLFPHRHYIRGTSVAIAGLLQFLLLLDVLTYRALGYHLSAVSIRQLSRVEDYYVSRLGDGYFYLLLVALLVIIGMQFLLSNVTWKRLKQLQAIPFKNAIARSLVVLFLSSHVMHLWADATFNSDIAKQNNLFPLSYPLTAKTLLAKYELIDLQAYQDIQEQQIRVARKAQLIKPLVATQCNIEDKPKLNIEFIRESQIGHVAQWLRKHHVSFATSRRFIVAQDLDTVMFNFATGLPGLYADMLPDPEERDINRLFAENLITMSIQTGEFDTEQPFHNSTDLKAYVFYQADKQQPFSRSHVILVGFKGLKRQTLAPQNIIASYINDALQCGQFVDTNLIDKPIAQVHSDYIHANYSNGYFHVVYKDKAMTFKQGHLTSNRAFSNDREVDEALDLSVVQQAIQIVTSLRDNAE